MKLSDQPVDVFINKFEKIKKKRKIKLFYVNKRNPEEVVELIHSESGFCIVIDQEDTLAAGSPVGRIIKRGKKQFKKDFKKASPKLVRMEPVDEYQKEKILEQLLNDKISILKHTEEYVEHKKRLDRKAYFDSLTDEEYERSLERLADPIPAKSRKNLLKAKEALRKLNSEIEY